MFGAALSFASACYSIKANDDEDVYLRMMYGSGSGSGRRAFVFIADSVPHNTFSRNIVYLSQIARLGYVLVDAILLLPGGWRVIAPLQTIVSFLLFPLTWVIASYIWIDQWSGGNSLMIAHGNQQTAGGFFARRHRMQLIMMIMVPLFQQLTGIVIFGTRLHRAMSGYRPSVALGIDIGCNIVSILATLASVYLVERRGITWRVIFTVGSLVMFISHLLISIIVGVLPFHRHMDTVLSICTAVFYAGFGLSWGPLAIPISVEHLRLSPEIWTIGIACLLTISSISSIFVSFGATLIMCRYGPAVVNAVLWMFMLLILAFSIFLIPSTVGGEHLANVIHEHFYWRRFHEE